MPPARSSSSRHGSRQPLQPQPTLPNIDQEVIVLSSDDDEPAPPKLVAKRKMPVKDSRQRGKAKPRPAPVRMGDIVEIPSEEGSPQRESIGELKRQLEKAKFELEQLKRAKTTPAPARVATASTPADLTHKMNRLEEECVLAKASSKRLLDTLEEQLACEMCYEKMWQPYSLACGHTYCRSCLQNWFTTELAKHMGAHPGYNPTPSVPRQYRELLRRPDIQPYQRTHLVQQLQRIYNEMHHPDYTCPTCRKPVTRKPIEAFTVKNIVAVVTEAEAAQSRSQGKPVASPRRAGPSRAREDNPFGGFFPDAADLLEGQ